MRKLILGLTVVVVTAVSGVWALGAKDDSWPSKTIQVIIPYSPGGDSDFNARQYVTRLGAILGKPVVASNVTGNAGAIAGTQVKNSAPDGYTVLFWHTSMFVNKAAGVSEMVIDDFEPAVILASVGGYCLVVNAKTPYRSLKDIMDASKSNPDNLIFAMNIGAASQLYGVLLNQAGAKFKLADVGDAAQRVTNLLGGHIAAIPSPVGAAAPYFDSGDFRPLAMMASERNSVFPNIPTTVELGYPQAILPIYYFFAFPKGTPKDIIDKFAAACEQVSKDPEYRANILKTYQQDPYFKKGPEALTILRTQESSIIKLSGELRK